MFLIIIIGSCFFQKKSVIQNITLLVQVAKQFYKITIL